MGRIVADLSAADLLSDGKATSAAIIALCCLAVLYACNRAYGALYNSNKEVKDIIKLGALDIGHECIEPLRRINVPKAHFMSIFQNGPEQTDEVQEFGDATQDNPTLENSVCRPYYDGKAYSISTAAVLVRGPEDELKVAVSGWAADRPHRHHQLPAAEHLIRVQVMCRKIGHDLAYYWRDEEHRGRFYACHAEK